MQVVLLHPDIPQNTGNIGRTCVANGIPLHLIKPMGFRLDEKNLARAGLDYWKDLDVSVHESWDTFFSKFAPNASRFFFFSRSGSRSLWEADFSQDSFLIFGSETLGLPKEILRAHSESVYRIPMSGPVRSLNLATSVGISVYEALRQTAAE